MQWTVFTAPAIEAAVASAIAGFVVDVPEYMRRQRRFQVERETLAQHLGAQRAGGGGRGRPLGALVHRHQAGALGQKDMDGALQLGFDLHVTVSVGR